MSSQQFKQSSILITTILATVFIAYACQPLPPAPELQAGGLKWQYQVNYKPGDEGSPAISGDGTIYLVADNRMHAVIDADNQGQNKGPNWPFGGYTQLDTYTHPGLQSRRIQVYGIPVVTVDERVLTSARRTDIIWRDKNNDGELDFDETIVENKYILYALAANGEIAWYIEDMRLNHPPAAAVDGSIYAIVERGNQPNFDPRLVKVSSPGTIKGEVDLNFAGAITASPATSPDGHVYLLGRIGAQNSDLYRLDLRDQDSNQWVVGEWHVELTGTVKGSMAVDQNGTVYVGTQFYIQAINADQTEKWKTWLNADFDSTPSLGVNNVLYAAADNGKLYALYTNTGVQLWQDPADSGTSITSTPAIGGGPGRIYIASNNGIIWAQKPDGSGEEWFTEIGGYLPGSPVISRTGTLYIAALDGYLYALNTDATGLANSDWPMYHRNTYHTNSAQKIADLDPDWNTAYTRMFTQSSDLLLLHQYRDEYLLDKSAVGSNYVKRLYKSADEALRILINNPELMSQARALLAQNRSALTLVLQGKPAEIKNTKEILSFIDLFAANAGGTLKQLLKDVQKDMQDSQRQKKAFIGIMLH